MKIENIRLFLDVVRYGSINKAAEKNFIAQQNLSVTIKNMEKELAHPFGAHQCRHHFNRKRS